MWDVKFAYFGLILNWHSYFRSIKSNHNFEPEMWKRVALLQIEGVNLEMIDSSCTKSKDIFKQRVWLVYRRYIHVFHFSNSLQPFNVLFQEMF